MICFIEPKSEACGANTNTTLGNPEGQEPPKPRDWASIFGAAIGGAEGPNLRIPGLLPGFRYRLCSECRFKALARWVVSAPRDWIEPGVPIKAETIKNHFRFLVEPELRLGLAAK